MFRAACARVRSVKPAHLFVAGLACLLIVTLDGLLPQPAEAGGVARQMGATRRAQVRAESTMRRVDRRIKVLKRHKVRSQQRARAAARRLARTKDRRAGARARLRFLGDRRDVAVADRDRTLRVRPNPAGAQVTDRPALRKRVRKLAARFDRIDRKVDRLQRKAQKTRRVRQARLRGVERARQGVARKTSERERAETALGGRIMLMVELAQQRAATRTGSRPAASGFKRPARGSISQGYGCQRSRKGRCLHFHDGIDIATRSGTPVRASATGYVAYVGWNPWDRGRRAFIVIIGHAGGYETIYGHLKPVRRVRAGQFVRRGQRIGLSGNTGQSTGPHVHWEVSRGFKTMNPRSVGRRSRGTVTTPSPSAAPGAR